MDILKKLLSDIAFNNLGIAPIDGDKITADFNRTLDSVSPKEARKMKRKFRKLWRKYAQDGKLPKRYTERLGLGSKEPTREQKKARKEEVLRRVKSQLADTKNILKIE